MISIESLVYYRMSMIRKASVLGTKGVFRFQFPVASKACALVGVGSGGVLSFTLTPNP